jgi:hypothetical protein
VELKSSLTEKEHNVANDEESAKWDAWMQDPRSDDPETPDEIVAKPGIENEAKSIKVEQVASVEKRQSASAPEEVTLRMG